MKKTKNLAALVLATAAIFMSGFSALATEYSYNPDVWNYSYNDGAHGTEIDGVFYEDKISDLMNEDLVNKNVYKTPGWVWLDGYCYYLTAEHGWDIVFKNGTTPDGYTVDEQGRWTINGVPQRDNLGHQSFWAGKNMFTSDIERWDTIRKSMYQYWRTHYRHHEFSGNDKNCVVGDTSSDYIIMNPVGYGETPVYLSTRVYEYNKWGGQSQHASALVEHQGENPYSAEMKLKAVLGDNEGQRFYDYWNSLRTSTVVSQTYLIDGVGGKESEIWLPGECTKTDYSLYNPAVFMNRMTDYGRPYKVVYYKDQHCLEINVY